MIFFSAKIKRIFFIAGSSSWKILRGYESSRNFHRTCIGVMLCEKNLEIFSKEISLKNESKWFVRLASIIFQMFTFRKT